MRPLPTALLCASALALLAGCATTPSTFYAGPAAVSDVTLCRTMSASSDMRFVRDVQLELVRRGIPTSDCPVLVRNQDVAIGAVVAGATVVAVAAASRNSDVYAAVDVDISNDHHRDIPVDYDWEWDEFYMNSELVWACRGVQSALLVPSDRCTYKTQADLRWPAKHEPFG